MADMHEIDYKIFGDDMQFVEVELDPNEATVAEAGEGLHQASLIYLGLALFFITFVVLALAKLLLTRLKKNEGTRS